MTAHEANDDNLSEDLRRQLVDPQALAVQERFLDEWRAGRRPRLSVYARRYPAYAEALAALVAALPPEPLSSAPAQSPAEAEGLSVDARTSAESFLGRRALDASHTTRDSDLDAGSQAGVARALASIFGAEAALAIAQDERPLPQVAERAANYYVTPADAPADPKQPLPPAPPTRD